MVKEAHILNFENSLHAWEGINEYLFLSQQELEEKSMGKFGPQIVSYNNIINIRNSFVPEDFDFGHVLGYRIQKWNSLVKNYVDMNKLDLLKSNVQTRIRKAQKNFNESMTFDNYHGNGKGCLLSITCSKRFGQENNYLITFFLRSSEVTRRLLFDLLLVHRMGEYIFGKEADVSLQLMSPYMYQNAEAFSLYNNHKDMHQLFDVYFNQVDEYSDIPIGEYKFEWAYKCLEILDLYLEKDPREIKFRAHKRSAEQLQRVSGKLKTGYKHLYTRDMQIVPERKRFNKETISIKEHQKEIKYATNT